MSVLASEESLCETERQAVVRVLTGIRYADSNNIEPLCAAYRHLIEGVQMRGRTHLREKLPSVLAQSSGVSAVEPVPASDDSAIGPADEHSDEHSADVDLGSRQ